VNGSVIRLICSVHEIPTRDATHCFAVNDEFVNIRPIEIYNASCIFIKGLKMPFEVNYDYIRFKQKT
jgi:hypothetical protein